MGGQKATPPSPTPHKARRPQKPTSLFSDRKVGQKQKAIRVLLVTGTVQRDLNQIRISNNIRQYLHCPPLAAFACVSSQKLLSSFDTRDVH